MPQTCFHTGGYVFEDKVLLCDNVPGGAGRMCPSGYECVVSDTNPFFGIIHFDNVLHGAMTVFQCITMEVGEKGFRRARS